MTIRVNVRNLLQFFDEDEGATGHSSAIKNFIGEEFAFEILKKHFHEQGQVTIIASCTTGGKPGHWLDGWLTLAVDGKLVDCYQVEIKMWSFHGIGSRDRRLVVDCDPAYLQEHKKKVWKCYWDNENKLFSDEKVNKVLLRMKPPKGGVTIPVKPMLCVWEAVHPDGKLDEFFPVPVAAYEKKKSKRRLEGGGFEQVHIFSVSSYLRNRLAAGTEFLDLNLPKLQERLAWLDSLFGRDAAPLLMASGLIALSHESATVNEMSMGMRDG